MAILIVYSNSSRDCQETKDRCETFIIAQLFTTNFTFLLGNRKYIRQPLGNRSCVDYVHIVQPWLSVNHRYV